MQHGKIQTNIFWSSSSSQKKFGGLKHHSCTIGG
jgi:hypothetical protein